MLVLTRRIGEAILIADDVVVTLLDIRGSRVRLGVSAPNAVRVVRQEVLERVARTLPDDAAAGVPAPAVATTKTARCARCGSVVHHAADCPLG